MPDFSALDNISLISGIHSSGATYTIFQEGSLVKARNNKTGIIQYSDTTLGNVMISVLSSGDPSVEIQSGTFNLASGFAGWNVPANAIILMQKDTQIKVPNAYTGYIFNWGSNIQYTQVEGGKFDEQGTPSSNWTCFKFSPATPNGTLFNTIRDSTVLRAKYAIHLLTDTNSWANSNLFQNVLADRCKYHTYFEHTSTFTSGVSGSNGNNFVNCILQSNATTPQVLGGILNVNGTFNTFSHCVIWDIQNDNASAASMTITANAQYTTIEGGALTYANYTDSGLRTTRSDYGSGGGLDTTGPISIRTNPLTVNSKLSVRRTSGSSDWETVAEFGTTDSTDLFTIDNGYSDNTLFAPIIRATLTSTPANAFHNAMYFQGIVKASTDIFTSDGAVVVFASQTSTNAALVNRPLFSFRNYLTEIMTVLPTYVDFNSNTIKNAVLDTATVTLPTTAVTTTGTQILTNKTIQTNQNTLSGVTIDPTVKRTGQAVPITPSAAASATNIISLMGVLSNFTATGAGTNTSTMDATEGPLANWVTTTTAGNAAGILPPAGGVGQARRAFATRVRIRSKVDAVASSVSRLYFGFSSATSLPFTDTPLAVADSGIIVGFSSADTTYQIYHNDGATSVTKDAVTGAIAKDTAFHTIEINWTASGNVNIVFDGTVQTISADLPATTTNLLFYAVAQNATAAARTHSVKGIWFESDK